MIQEVLVKIIRIANLLDYKGQVHLANKIDKLVLNAISDDLVHHYKEQKELLENRVPEKISFQEKILLSHNITPLELHSQSDAMLGEGMYGYVYRAVYKGKEVAAKVLLDEKEAYIWKAILKAKDRFPSDLKKHFPKIYRIIEEKNYEVILMEILKPIDRNILNKLFKEDTDYSFKEQAPIISYLKDMGFVNKLVQDLNNFILKLQNWGEDIDIETQSKIKNIANNILSEAGQKYSASKVESDIIIQNIVQDIYNEVYFESSIFAKDISVFVEDYLTKISYGGRFPSRAPVDYEKPSTSWIEHVPEGKSLYNALMKLNDMGISWSDLHKRNLMIRPATGDLVIIDPGLYSIMT